jgi:competence protein ComEC
VHWACSDDQTLVPGPRHPALITAVLVAAGIVVCDRSDAGPAIWALLCLAALATSVGLFVVRRQMARLLAVFAVAGMLFSLGGLRLSVATFGRPDPTIQELCASNHAADIVGHIDGIPRTDQRGWRVPLAITHLHTSIGVIPLSARILLRDNDSVCVFRYGDRVRLRTRFRAPTVRRNPGAFDYADYLYHRGIDALASPVGDVKPLGPRSARWSPYRIIEPARVWIRATFTRYLAPMPRALILGFLLGDTEGLPQSVYRAVRDSGTLHLLAVSGANVWLIVGMLLLPLRLLRVPRWPRTVLLLIVVVLFSFLTRNEPSVVRASVMVAAILIGRLVSRPIAILNAIGFAGTIILLLSPLHLFRPGFQLSFAAVIAIVVVSQRARAWLPRRRRWLRGLVAVILSSLAATTVTAPILAWHFGRVPLAGVIANVVMIPIASAAAYLGVGLLAVSAISDALAVLIAHPTSWLLLGFAYMADLFSRFPQSVLSWPEPSLWAVINFYLCLFLILGWRHRYRWLRPILYYALICVAVGIASDFGQSKPEVAIAFPDAGSKRIIAVAQPDGKVIWQSHDGPIDENTRLWIIEPFQRTVFPHAGAAVVKPPRSNSLPLAELFAWQSDTVIVWPDVTKSGTAVPPLPADLGKATAIVLRANTPDHLVRRLIARLAPKMVLFAGGHPRAHYTDQWLARWRAHYPCIAFMSTITHGGVRLEWADAGLDFRPTIEIPVWRDPDFE